MLRRDIQDLYDQTLFLQAYARTAEYWGPGVDLHSFAAEDLVLGGRLAARLGVLRLSRELFRAAAVRAPNAPEVCYFAGFARCREDRYKVLHFYERTPELGTIRADLNASWFAGQGIT